MRGARKDGCAMPGTEGRPRKGVWISRVSQQRLYFVFCPLPQVPHGGRRSDESFRYTAQPQSTQQ